MDTRDHLASKSKALEKGQIFLTHLLPELFSLQKRLPTIFLLRPENFPTPFILLLRADLPSMAHHDSTGKSFTVAIVGGGIGGLALAIGLRHQGISVQIYEAAPAFAEIGAGIAFGPNAISAMYLIDPAIRDAFRRLATKNGFDEEDETWINFRSGFGEPTMIAKVQTGDQEKTGLSSVHRARFLDELASLIPKDIAHFGKRLLSFQTEASGKLTLAFEDGETAFADALVGADGVRSRVRQLLLGKESVLDGLSFTGKYAYRGLISMDKAREAVGDELAMNSQMYLGKDGHVLTYPIDHGKTMNVVAFKNKEDGLWEHDHWVLKSKGEDMRRDFAKWGTPVRSVLEVSDNVPTLVVDVLTSAFPES